MKDDRTLGLFLPKPIEPPPELPAMQRIEVVEADLPAENVVIEPFTDGRFIITLLRHHGTTFASFVATRAQLEMLIRRIPAALEVTR